MSTPVVIGIVGVGVIALLLWLGNRKYRIEKGER
jgi:hypothetical protein